MTRVSLGEHGTLEPSLKVSSVIQALGRVAAILGIVSDYQLVHDIAQAVGVESRERQVRLWETSLSRDKEAYRPHSITRSVK